MWRRESWAGGITHSLLRLVTGFFLMFHGAQKLLGWFGGIGSTHSTVPLGSRLGIAGVLELVGGGLLFLGLLTRPVAFILSGMMAVAYFTVHQPMGLWPILNQGELAAVYAFVFLYFAGNGAGPLSLDRLIFHDAEGGLAADYKDQRAGRAA